MDKNLLITNLIKQFEHIVSLYNAVEKTTYSYGTEIMLHPSEIHMIAAIGGHPDSNLTGLSKDLGITKGATTKMIQKLVKKGLVIKQFAPNSENEIALSLTAIGQKAYLGHHSYRKNLNQELTDIYAVVPENVLIHMETIGNKTEEIFKAMIVERSKQR
ncbi:MAG: MarR family winged helix-turn-helix transcriptional regulator [Sporolactobacillus sp.]